MGLLHKLWDETFAGPAPDIGLGKLRERPSSSATAAAAAGRSADPAAVVPRGVGSVSRRITIVRTWNQGGIVGPDSAPEPPAWSNSNPGTAPSHAASMLQGDFKKFTRRKSSQALEKAEPRSPTVFDWILISALDH